MKREAFEIFCRTLASVQPLTSEAEADIGSCFRYKNILKDSFLLKEGEAQSEVFFNSKGLFRYFYIEHSGEESVKHFSTNGQWAFSLSAFIKNSPSRFYIEAMEESHVLSVSAETLRKLISEKIWWQKLYHTLLEKYYVVKEDREADFLKNDAKGRYENFLNEYPTLAEKLKQHQIASYLGITPVTLSRIKNKKP